MSDFSPGMSSLSQGPSRYKFHGAEDIWSHWIQHQKSREPADDLQCHPAAQQLDAGLHEEYPGLQGPAAAKSDWGGEDVYMILYVE